VKVRKARKTKKNQECAQGIEARQKFERTMKALFQVPKGDSKKPEKGKD